MKENPECFFRTELSLTFYLLGDFKSMYQQKLTCKFVFGRDVNAFGVMKQITPEVLGFGHVGH